MWREYWNNYIAEILKNYVAKILQNWLSVSVCVAIKIFARYVAVFSCAGIFWGENKEKVIGELWVNKVGINRKEKSVV